MRTIYWSLCVSLTKHFNGLYYPHGKSWAPEQGEPFKVAEGVYWLRMPIPIDLDHINLWLLKDGEQWIIVDTGMCADTCKQVWQQVFDTFLPANSVKSIIVTHYHPDHVGLAGWLAEHFNCNLLMTVHEYNTANESLNFAETMSDKACAKFMHAGGFDEKIQGMYHLMLSAFRHVVSDLPIDYTPLSSGDVLSINHLKWSIVTGNGHSPEHACLYCPELNVLISGDQALPRITSNVSADLRNYSANPLEDWYVSCRKLSDCINDETLVLPSHQEPFVGIKMRMQQIISSHDEQLEKLDSYLNEPRTVSACTDVLFRENLPEIQRIFAAGETLAHLNYLMCKGDVSCIEKDDINYYQKIA